MIEDDIKANQEDLWRVDNYILLKDYLDRTISRVAARCVRTGNIAMEDYPFYGYILDVLDEICETGDYILSRGHMSIYVDEKIEGGMKGLKKNVEEYRAELKNNSSPEMVEEDVDLAMVKDIFKVDAFDPTKGAGMSTDDLIAKLTEAPAPEAESEPEPEPAPESESESEPKLSVVSDVEDVFSSEPPLEDALGADVEDEFGELFSADDDKAKDILQKIIEEDEVGV